MVTRDVIDLDGTKIFLSGRHEHDLRGYERKLRAKAKAIGCQMREVPQLRKSRAGRHSSIPVTGACGRISGIDWTKIKHKAPVSEK